MPFYPCTLTRLQIWKKALRISSILQRSTLGSSTVSTTHRLTCQEATLMLTGEEFLPKFWSMEWTLLSFLRSLMKMRTWTRNSPTPSNQLECFTTASTQFIRRHILFRFRWTLRSLITWRQSAQYSKSDTTLIASASQVTHSMTVQAKRLSASRWKAKTLLHSATSECLSST